MGKSSLGNELSNLCYTNKELSTNAHNRECNLPRPYQSAILRIKDPLPSTNTITSNRLFAHSLRIVTPMLMPNYAMPNLDITYLPSGARLGLMNGLMICFSNIISLCKAQVLLHPLAWHVHLCLQWLLDLFKLFPLSSLF